MPLPRLAPVLPSLVLPVLLAACAGPGEDLAMLGHAALLNRLPPQVGGFVAQGPALEQPATAARRYQVTGALAVVTLGRPPAEPPVPDGPDAAETRVLLERLTTAVMHRPGGETLFGPWRRDNDLRVQNRNGPPVRCSTLRRPREGSEQVQYSCITGLHGRYFTTAITVNHNAANRLGAQNLAGNFTAVVARLLASGEMPPQPRPDAIPTPAAEDDAVPDGAG